MRRRRKRGILGVPQSLYQAGDVLTATDLRVLFMIAAATARGMPLTFREIAAELGVYVHSAYERVTNLIAAGLVKRGQNHEARSLVLNCVIDLTESFPQGRPAKGKGSSDAKNVKL